jgi:hypothetical protein
VKTIALIVAMLSSASAVFVRNDAERAKPNPTLHLQTPIVP